MEGRVRRSSTRVSISSYDVLDSLKQPPYPIHPDVSRPETPSLEGTEKHRYTKKEYMILLSMCLANLADFLMYSVLAPFFPTEAAKMGTSTTQVGLIFGSYALTMFIFSPIFGKLIPIVGAKFLFLAGSFMGGGTCFIFGFLNRLAPGTQFVTFCFITRILEAIGAAASSTGAYSIIAKTFRQNITTAFGTIEIFCGLGLMIGPPVGGALYQAGGYTLPFVVWGLFSMGIVVVNYFIVPSEGDESHRSGSLIQLLKIPSIIMTSICVLCGFMGIGFLDPTLADHLSQFDLSATQIGLMFLANSGAYAVSAFFWGWLTDKYDIPKVLMIIGNIASIIGFIYIGPSPLLNIKSELWLVAFSLVMLGLSLAASVLPTFNEMLSSARLHGMEENISTYGIISGLFSSLFSLGNFLGPTVGSAMVSHIGFEWTSTCFSGMYAFVATTLILFCLWEYRCGTRRKINPAVSRQLNIQDDDEKKPLLA